MEEGAGENNQEEVEEANEAGRKVWGDALMFQSAVLNQRWVVKTKRLWFVRAWQPEMRMVKIRR